MRIGVIIPALNEQDCIATVVRECIACTPADDELRVVVCDNGSSDKTAPFAAQAGAEVVEESKRGYGAACLRALAHIGDWPDVVVFVDGDGSTDTRQIADVLHPIKNRLADMVIGWRECAEPGSMSLAQRFGNALSCRLIRMRWGFRYKDCGPLRASSAPALQALKMQDKTWGWNIEMQIKALQLGLRIAQVPVSWNNRIAGSSKISGTLSGILRAGTKILLTVARFSLRPAARRNAEQVLLSFVKAPHAGRVKTRLQQDIGSEHAVAVYKRLASEVFRKTRVAQDTGLLNSVVYYTGAHQQFFRRWLHGASSYWQQPHGDLTERLNEGFRRAFASGAKKVIVQGSDCVEIPSGALWSVCADLDEHDMVVIPAVDGGFALLGLRSLQPDLFADVPWSSPQTLEALLESAQALNLTVKQYDSVHDVDVQDNLSTLPPLISIVVPVHNESANLQRLLPEIRGQIAEHVHDIELIIVDGASSDDSASVAKEFGHVVHAPRGRALQMNHGARCARGAWLLFWHADNRMLSGTIQELSMALVERTNRDWGHFRARIDSAHWYLRLIGLGINLRSHLFRLPYGDQSIFVHRQTFQRLGGFREVPILEDVLLVRKLNQLSRPCAMKTAVGISPRRWEQHGKLKTTRRNWRVLFDHLVRKKDLTRIAEHQLPGSATCSGARALNYDKGA